MRNYHSYLNSFSNRQVVYFRLYLVVIMLIAFACTKEEDQVDRGYKMEITSFQSVTFHSANVEVDLQIENLTEVSECGICVSINKNPDINSFSFHMPVIKNGKEVIYTYALQQKTTYYVRAFAKDQAGICHYGPERSFTTSEKPPKPQNLDYFTITVSRQKLLLSGVYIPLMKQYKLTILEYSKVEYKWSCTDKTVVGVVASTRAFTPNDGYPWTSSFSQIFDPSGYKLFSRWDGLSGYLQFYIRTYNSKYYYSDDYILVQEYIEGERTYDIWSDKPYL